MPGRAPVAAARIAFLLMMTGLMMTGPAAAGVRVDEPKPASASPRPDLPHRTNLQIGAGPVGAATDLLGSTRAFGASATAAIEKVIDPRWSWIARCDYVRFEHSEQLSFGPAAGDVLPPQPPGSRLSRTTVTTVEFAARYSPPSGTVHPYFEFGAGCGRRESLQEDQVPGDPEIEDELSSRTYRVTLDFTIGGAWQPARIPFGLFGEMRFVDQPGRHDAIWLGPRLGLLALTPGTP